MTGGGSQVEVGGWKVEDDWQSREGDVVEEDNYYKIYYFLK